MYENVGRFMLYKKNKKIGVICNVCICLKFKRKNIKFVIRIKIVLHLLKFRSQWISHTLTPYQKEQRIE